MPAQFRATLALLVLCGLARLPAARGSALPNRTLTETGGAPGPEHRADLSKADLLALCADGTLPDGDVCVPVPETERGAETLLESSASHRDRRGTLRVYDQIPRRPDRPREFERFRLPIAAVPGQAFVGGGYDLDLPDAVQRRGAELKAVGHGGVDLAQRRGARVTLVTLEHQVGDADVLFVGKLFGTSVITHHALREGGELRDYLVIFGHLEGAAPGLGRGATIKDGQLVGYVGDSGSPGVVHLHLEVRRARLGISLSALAPGELVQNARTVACDPRNVLPLLP